MDQSQIRQIVKMTIDELDQRNMLKDPYQDILQRVNKMLYGYFDGTAKNCIGISSILRQLSDDPYIDIIYLQYRDGKTLEWIAEYYRKDTSTIKRNKKRLISAIYEMIREC